MGIFVGLLWHESLLTHFRNACLLTRVGLALGDTKSASPLSTPKREKERGKIMPGDKVGGLKFARIIHMSNWALTLGAKVLFFIMIFDMTIRGASPNNRPLLGSECGPETFLLNHLEEKKMLILQCLECEYINLKVKY